MLEYRVIHNGKASGRHASACLLHDMRQLMSENVVAGASVKKDIRSAGNGFYTRFRRNIAPADADVFKVRPKTRLKLFKQGRGHGRGRSGMRFSEECRGGEIGGRRRIGFLIIPGRGV
jgi:hypothetical protein